MRKYSAEDKTQMVKLVLEAKHSIASLSASEGIHPTTLEEWIRNYQSMGSEAFFNKGWVKRTAVEKETAVQEYLSGLGSLRDICKKYKISSTRTLRLCRRNLNSICKHWRWQKLRHSPYYTEFGIIQIEDSSIQTEHFMQRLKQPV